MIIDEINAFIYNLDEYLRYPSKKEKVSEIIGKLRNILIDEKNKEKLNTGVYREFKDVIDLIISYDCCDPVILILKNEDNKFDMYIFKNGLSVNINDVFSSENFMEKIRKEAIKGFVISDILPLEILNFLKAYYLFRQDPKQVSSALNIAYDYNNECLEMVSILDKFTDIVSDKSTHLINVIAYDADALPYSLEYLNKYKEECDNSSFSELLDDVCSDKYLGTSLSKVQGWW